MTDMPQSHEARVPSQRVSAEIIRAALARDAERTASRRLAVFPGAFTAQAASAVCAELDGESGRWQEVLTELAGKKLLQPLIRLDGEGRFRQTDSIRLSELRQLRRAGEWDLVHERLVGWLMKLAEPDASQVEPPPSSRRSVRRDRDAFLAGVQWALARGDDRASLLATSLSQSWWDSGRTGQARDLLTAVTSVFDRPTAWVGAAEGQAARFAFHAGDYEQGLEMAARCARTERILDRPVRRGGALAVAGWCHLERGEMLEGRARCEESREVLRSLRQRDLRVALLPDVVQSLILLGDLDEATSLLEDDWAEARAAGHPSRSRNAFLSGQIALAGADPIDAEVAFADALRSELHYPSSAWLLTGLTITASMRGDHSRTLLLAAAARTRCLAMGVRPGRWWRRHFATAVAQAQGTLAPAHQSAARAAGEELDLEEVAEFLLDERFNELRPKMGNGQRLTRGEREVAVRFAEGLTISQIAARLGISVRAAESHLHHVREKTGIRSRTQMGIWISRLLNNSR